MKFVGNPTLPMDAHIRETIVSRSVKVTTRRYRWAIINAEKKKKKEKQIVRTGNKKQEREKCL